MGKEKDPNEKIEERKLIKFSNYSLCITLPKSTITKLGWQKGDVVRLLVDEQKGEILIRKGLRTPKVKEVEVKKVDNKKNPTDKKNPKKSRW